MEIRFLGQSCVELTEGDTRVLVDPFLTGNPKAAVSADEVTGTVGAGVFLFDPPPIGSSARESGSSRVYRPLGLTRTSLPSGPEMPRPFVRGYDVKDNPPSDVSESFAAGWTWASGGIVSTPADATRFVRGYVRALCSS